MTQLIRFNGGVEQEGGLSLSFTRDQASYDGRGNASAVDTPRFGKLRAQYAIQQPATTTAHTGNGTPRIFAGGVALDGVSPLVLGAETGADNTIFLWSGDDLTTQAAIVDVAASDVMGGTVSDRVHEIRGAKIVHGLIITQCQVIRTDYSTGDIVETTTLCYSQSDDPGSFALWPVDSGSQWSTDTNYPDPNPVGTVDSATTMGNEWSVSWFPADSLAEPLDIWVTFTDYRNNDKDGGCLYLARATRPSVGGSWTVQNIRKIDERQNAASDEHAHSCGMLKDAGTGIWYAIGFYGDEDDAHTTRIQIGSGDGTDYLTATLTTLDTWSGGTIGDVNGEKTAQPTFTFPLFDNNLGCASDNEFWLVMGIDEASLTEAKASWYGLGPTSGTAYTGGLALYGEYHRDRLGYIVVVPHEPREGQETSSDELTVMATTDGTEWFNVSPEGYRFVAGPYIVGLDGTTLKTIPRPTPRYVYPLQINPGGTNRLNASNTFVAQNSHVITKVTNGLWPAGFQRAGEAMPTKPVPGEVFAFDGTASTARNIGYSYLCEAGYPQGASTDWGFKCWACFAQDAGDLQLRVWDNTEATAKNNLRVASSQAWTPLMVVNKWETVGHDDILRIINSGTATNKKTEGAILLESVYQGTWPPYYLDPGTTGANELAEVGGLSLGSTWSVSVDILYPENVDAEFAQGPLLYLEEDANNWVKVETVANTFPHDVVMTVSDGGVTDTATISNVSVQLPGQPLRVTVYSDGTDTTLKVTAGVLASSEATPATSKTCVPTLAYLASDDNVGTNVSALEFVALAAGTSATQSEGLLNNAPRTSEAQQLTTKYTDFGMNVSFYNQAGQVTYVGPHPVWGQGGTEFDSNFGAYEEYVWNTDRSINPSAEPLVDIYGQFEWIRVMNWTAQLAFDKNQDWLNRVIAADEPFWGPGTGNVGLPIEAMIQFANQCNSKMAWTMPQQSSTDFMFRAGVMFARLYEPSVLILEGPNEIWNGNRGGWYQDYELDFGSGWFFPNDWNGNYGLLYQRHALDFGRKQFAFMSGFNSVNRQALGLGTCEVKRIIAGQLANPGVLFYGGGALRHLAYPQDYDGYFVACYFGDNASQPGKYNEATGAEHDPSRGIFHNGFAERTLFYINDYANAAYPIGSSGDASGIPVGWYEGGQSVAYAGITPVDDGELATISTATAANPVVVTTDAAHGMSTGDHVYIDGVSGQTELNQRQFIITVTGSTTFSLNSENGTGRSAGTGGNVASQVLGEWRRVVRDTAKPVSDSYGLPCFIYSGVGDRNASNQSVFNIYDGDDPDYTPFNDVPEALGLPTADTTDPGGDTDPPTLAPLIPPQILAGGNQILITFSEPVTGATGFTLTVDAGGNALSNPVYSGVTITFDLASTVYNQSTATLDYTAGNVTDTAGNALANFSNEPVDVSLADDPPDTTAPELLPGFGPFITTVGTKLLIIFTENITMTTSGFTLTVDGAGNVLSNPVVSGSTITFDVTGTIEQDSIVTLDYDSGTGDVEDLASNALASFSDVPVDLSGAAPITSNLDSGPKTGPNDPTLGATLAYSPAGLIDWADPTNIYAADGLYAEVGSVSGGESRYLIASNFGFKIPEMDVIRGIQFDIYRKWTGVSQVSDARIRLLRNNVVEGFDKALIRPWELTGGFVYRTYGGPTDLWGNEWTAADINNEGFGLAMSVQIAGGGATTSAQVDHVRATVYHGDGGRLIRDILISGNIRFRGKLIVR